MQQEPELDLKKILCTCKKIPYTTRIIKGKDNLGHKTINQYSIIQKLGEGAFGTVKLAQENEIQQKFALKIYGK